jgi:hypothetical protein
MKEVLEHDGYKKMVYATVDEKDFIDKMFRIKDAAATYYNKGKKAAYHWILNPITAAKLQIPTK